MPREGAPSPTKQSTGAATCYGQVIEYIRDRLYLASYTHAPNAHTPFPYPLKASGAKSPGKRSSRAAARDTPSSATASGGSKTNPPAYFSIDNSLHYNAFHADFGPLHIGHLYRFAVTLHEVLAAPENADRGIVFWSYADSKSRANAACILACYMVLLQHWPPHLALAPIAQMDPPCMPFRDAGYSQADYVLNIQDVVYGVWKAKEEGLCNLQQFSLEEYETFERVENGDFNWISPSFLAFASPQHSITAPILPSDPAYLAIPRNTAAVEKYTDLSRPFKNVLTHFAERDIGLVVRLNDALYSSTFFTALGIQHLDMIFDDGTCPPLPLVRKFIKLAHDVITVKKKGIAVHCKAGLGRTGCLIGAYLIYRHGFTANEIIAFMRFMRPGMVVGPQQHWLHLNQGTFREWWFEDSVKEKVLAMQPATPPRASIRASRLTSSGATYTPPGSNHKRSALGEIDSNEQAAVNNSMSGNDDSFLPAPTPGQPRKTSKAYGRVGKGGAENEPYVMPDTEIVSMQRHVQDESCSEEEFQLRLLSRRSSRSPGTSAGRDKRRAVSCTSTTVTTWAVDDGDSSDVENRSAAAPGSKTRSPNRSPSGKGEINVNRVRGSPVRRATEAKSGVRKVSGRVGSIGSTGVKAK